MAAWVVLLAHHSLSLKLKIVLAWSSLPGNLYTSYLTEDMRNLERKAEYKETIEAYIFINFNIYLIHRSLYLIWLRMHSLLHFALSVRVLGKHDLERGQLGYLFDGE